MKRTITLVFFILLLFSISSCGENVPVSRTGFYFDTVVTVTIFDDDADPSLIESCFDICRNYENKLSRTVESSMVARFNRGEITRDELDGEMRALISYALEITKISDGAFDIFLEPLTSLWNFSGGRTEPPSESEIKEALLQCNVSERIDAGAIAKGLIADKLKEFLVSKGIKSALINLGGNVLCIGAHPDGTPFNIGIQKPFSDSGEVIKVLPVTDLTVVSSGIYERNFESGGKLYHHILDPKTGYPADTGLLSVTVVCESSMQADALSTACFVLGEEKGAELIKTLPGVTAYFVDENNTVKTVCGPVK